MRDITEEEVKRSLDETKVGKALGIHGETGNVERRGCDCIGIVCVCILCCQWCQLNG